MSEPAQPVVAGRHSASGAVPDDAADGAVADDAADGGSGASSRPRLSALHGGELHPLMRQGVSLVAVASLLAGLSGAVISSSSLPQLSTFVLVCGWAAVLLLSVCILTTRNARRLAQIDVVTLVVGIVLQLMRFGNATWTRVTPGASDETLFNRLATNTLLAGHNPYTRSYPLVGADGSGTPLFSGGTADRYAYPPLPLEISKVLGSVRHSFGAPPLIEAIFLVVLAVASFFMVPVVVRPVSITLVLGLALFTPYALAGYAIVATAALLCLPFYRWTSTGAGGRLGLFGVSQAVCLGLACCCQQLAWLVWGFLVLAVLQVRRGELGFRRALAVTVRYALVSLGVFFVVNLPFIVADAHAWASALLSLFTQKAIVFGQGLALPTLVAHGGSGAIGELNYATFTLLFALVIIFVLDFRRLAPAVAILPSLAYLLSTRIATNYFAGFLPLWLISLSTMDRAAVDAVRVPALLSAAWLRRLFRTTRRRVAGAVVLILPALGMFFGGLMTPPPLHVQVLRAEIDYGRLATVTVRVHNASDTELRPAFYIDARTGITHRWVPESGRLRLAAGATRVLRLRAQTEVQQAAVTNNLYVFTTMPDPMSMTATRLTLGPKRISSLYKPPSAVWRARAWCYTLLLGGHPYDCTTQLGLSQLPPQRRGTWDKPAEKAASGSASTSP